MNPAPSLNSHLVLHLNPASNLPRSFSSLQKFLDSDTKPNVQDFRVQTTRTILNDPQDPPQEENSIILFSKVCPAHPPHKSRGKRCSWDAESKIRAGIPQITPNSAINPSSNFQGQLKGFYLPKNLWQRLGAVSPWPAQFVFPLRGITNCWELNTKKIPEPPNLLPHEPNPSFL